MQIRAPAAPLIKNMSSGLCMITSTSATYTITQVIQSCELSRLQYLATIIALRPAVNLVLPVVAT